MNTTTVIIPQNTEKQSQKVNIAEEIQQFLPGAKPVLLRGYSKNNNDYSVAKRPISKGWGKKDFATYQAPPQTDIEQHVFDFGWIGAALSEAHCVVDVDPLEDAFKNQLTSGHELGAMLFELLKDNGCSFHAIKSPRGMQFIFKKPEQSKIKNDTKAITKLGLVVDYRTDGGQIVWPIKETPGRFFVHTSDRELDEVPSYLFPFVLKIYTSGEQPEPKFPVFPFREGGRNNDLNGFLFSVRRESHGLMEKSELAEIAQHVNNYFVEPPLEKSEVEATVNSVMSAVIKPATGSTSSGAAQKSDHPLKGRYFGGEKGNTFIPKSLALEILQEKKIIFDGNSLYMYAGGVYKSINDFVIRKECLKKLGEMFKKSYGDEVVHYIQVNTYRKPEENAQDTQYINVLNGLLDWKKRELVPHTADLFTTIQLPVMYNPKAVAPNVQRFFTDVVPGDTLLTIYEWFGYSMLPITKFEKAVILEGSGSNGKSKFIELYERFIGTENISNVPLQDLEHNRFKLAQLYGKLANTFADIPASALEKASVFKTVVSGDRTSAEFKGRDSFDFKPFARLVFSANEMPRSSDLTFGFFRRLIIIPFPNKFGEGGQQSDPNIMNKLTTEEELSGLLNLALLGLQRLEANGAFTENETTKEAIKRYRIEIDNVATFIEECCTIKEAASVERTGIYKKYTAWCIESGYKALGKSKFFSRLENTVTVSIYKPHGGSRRYKGLGLNEFH